jgi:hypothetical protein
MPQDVQDKRRTQRYRDQHGRQWIAIVEKSTGDPCSPFTPHGWTAPLQVPDSYKKVDPNEPGKMDIQYDRWLEHLHEEHQAYRHRLEHIALQLSDTDAAKLIASPNPTMLRKAGAPPMAWQPVAAAKSGNRWVLGLPNPVTGKPMAKPDWALEFYPDAKPVQAGMTPTGFSFDATSFADARDEVDEDDEADDDFGGDSDALAAAFQAEHHLQAAKRVRNADVRDLPTLADSEFSREDGGRASVVKAFVDRGFAPAIVEG